jgi:penicillin-binding protein 1C
MPPPPLRKTLLAGILLACGFTYYFSLPGRLFKDPYACVLEDRNGQLLSARIASDGQWRFPEADSVPPKFLTALILQEDKRFRTHWGVDPMALGRALRQNLQAGGIVSGGSTITMQVIRLSRRGKPRTVFQKIIEIILATRLELRLTKDEILCLYASHAPFGGNVVGLEAASWRYYGRPPIQLSWAEAALLAVLPNNPSWIHPGRNRLKLEARRNELLQKLMRAGHLDTLSYSLALAEPIPAAPQPLPRLARHLLDRAIAEKQGPRVKSTLDAHWQDRIEQMVDDHHRVLKGNQVHNAAALVMEVETGHVLAYVGNTRSGPENQEEVDIVRSPRSTGSILKPFLYAAMQDDGRVLPTSLVSDVPTFINGFAPQNFSRSYDGVVPASEALIRSLNIPAVIMLQEYRPERFHDLLRRLGMTTLHRSADHYGLSLIVGGAEGTLWDITGMYGSVARQLTHYFGRAGSRRYHPGFIHPPVYTAGAFAEIDSALFESHGPLSAGVAWITFETLRELYRPGEESGWTNFISTKPIAWKTGTSHGLRDGWAIGLNPEFVVGVWVGNADGEGRPGLTGTDAAAPLMLSIFSSLPGRPWFERPLAELTELPVCSQSGFRPGPYCADVDTVWAQRRAVDFALCSYHQQVHLSADGRHRVTSECERVAFMTHRPWFVLPSVQEYYFKRKNLSYRALPPWRADCTPSGQITSLALIYPVVDSKVFVPVLLDGTAGSALFRAAHRDPGAAVFWHLDERYLGMTRSLHQMEVNPSPGPHTLTLVDDRGEVLTRSFRAESR